MTFAILIIGLLLLPVFYDQFFPFKRPNLSHYFTPGQRISSQSEGITQTILRISDNRVYSELRLEPGARGPIKHKHQHFDERLTIISGTLSVTVGDSICSLTAGERLFFPKDVYHSMCNDGAEPVVLRSENEEDHVPVEFVYALSRLYAVLPPNGSMNLRTWLNLAVLDDLLDSLPFGPPPSVFLQLRKMTKPYARLLGFSPYDKRSRPA